jgi:hypothetical protein
MRAFGVGSAHGVGDGAPVELALVGRCSGFAELLQAAKASATRTAAALLVDRS